MVAFAMLARCSAALVLLTVVSGLCGAGPGARRVLVFNRGSLPIYHLQMGHEENKTWSGDLLRFNDVIDVGEAKSVPVVLAAECLFDLRATHRDGTVDELRDVDLCVSQSVTFEH